MEAPSGERDGGGDRCLGCWAKRPVGPVEGAVGRGQCAVKGQDRSRRDALIKAVVADFETAEGRSIARDGLNKKLAGSKPAEIKAKCIETLRQAGAVVDAKAPGDA